MTIANGPKQGTAALAGGQGGIAIVGMGCRFPGARHLSDYWRVIRDGRVLAGPIPAQRWDHDLFFSENGAREHNKTYARKLALIDDLTLFSPDFFGLAPRRVKVMDPQQRLILEATRCAIEDAGYAARAQDETRSLRRFPRDRTGVFVGATSSDFGDIVTARLRATQILGGQWARMAPLPSDDLHRFAEDVVPVQAYTLVGALVNMTAANVSQCFEFGGPSYTADAACSSALVALGDAVLHLRAGLCDAAVVGGAYNILSPDNMVVFSRIGALSATDTCRPYDQRADGFFIGEGAGVVLLKREQDALADGDRIYGVIRGIASNNDGRAEGPMTPRKEGQVLALESAYRDAGISIGTVGFIEGHGTATPVGDATEIAAIREVLGPNGSAVGCAVTSGKANIGHTMGAAGIAGLIRAGLVLRHRVIPPQAGFSVQRPDLGLAAANLRLPTVASPWDAPTAHPRRAAVNAFGFGGTNVHVVMDEAPAMSARSRVQIAVPALPRGAELIVLSAPTPALLAATLGDVARALPDLEPGVGLVDLSHTFLRRRADVARVAFVAQDLAHLLTVLNATALALKTSAPMPDGVHHSAVPRAPEDRRLALMFPGQGAQLPDLARDLYDRFPDFRADLERLALVVADFLPRPLLSYLYPPPSADRDAATAALTATEICQPAVVAVTLCIARLLTRLGVTPDMALGHSLGEFTAATFAGIIADDVAALKFVALRGRLMNQTVTGDPGAMLAVAATDEDLALHRAVADQYGVTIANLNHPRQVVLAGSTAGIDALKGHLDAASLRTTRLRVSHAFHSPLMAGLGTGLAAQVTNLPLAPAQLPLLSAIRVGVYPARHDEIRDLFTAHATSRVDFRGALVAASTAGARVFVQAGAGSALCTMAQLTVGALPGANAICRTLGGVVPDGCATFLETLGLLWTLGVGLDPAPLFASESPDLVTMLPPSRVDERALWPVSRREPSVQENEPVKRIPSLSATPPDGTSDLNDLFARQMAVLDAQVEIIKQQNVLLGRLGSDAPLPRPSAFHAAAPTSAPTIDAARIAAPATAAVVTDGPARLAPSVSTEQVRGNAGLSLAAIETKVIHAVARITAHPPEKLLPATRLGADLSFDSLMVTELMAALSEALPGAEPLPRSFFAADASIADVARHLASGAAKPVAAVRVALTSQTIERFVVETVAVPLSGPALAPAGPIVTLGGGAVADALHDLAQAQGIESVSLADGEPITVGATVLDLRGLDDADDATSSVLTAVAQRAFALGQRLDRARPATLLFAHRGRASLAIPGLAKALGREWTEAQVLSVALPWQGDSTAVTADRIFAEVGARHTAAAVTYQDGVRHVDALRAHPLPGATALGQKAVVVVSGGASGLGAKLSLALAQEFSARLILLGRRPAADVEPFLAQVREAGGQAIYTACDVRDGAAVAQALQSGRAAFGPIEFAVHAAGIVKDGPIGKKDSDSVGAVFDTKVAGAMALVEALAADPVKVVLSFGSWAGRFGNAHQVDYAAANQAVALLGSVFHAARPEVRFITVSLPPWKGSPMVAALPEAVRREMESRGVTFISDEVGLPRLLHELGAVSEPSGECLLGAAVPTRHSRAVLRETLSTRTHKWLDDHRVGGRVVLPLASAVDRMIAAAVATSALRTPGVVTVRDLAVPRGVILPDQGGDIVTRASADIRGGESTVDVELCSLSPQGAVLAYRARVTTTTTAAPPVLTPPGGDPGAISLDEFYTRHTFHGPRLRAVEHVANVGHGHITGTLRTGGPRDAAPSMVMAVDGALQLCAYWAVVHHGRIGLPIGVGEIRVVGPVPANARLECRALLRAEGADRFEGDIDLIDTTTGAPVIQLRAVRAELVVGVDTPAIDSATFKIAEFPEVKELRSRIEFVESSGIKNPYFRTLDGCTGATAVVDGKELINFTSYNYVGLSGDPRIVKAVCAAVERFGTSVSASRVTGGQKPLHEDLERAIARFLGTESSIAMVGGHATNVSVVGHIVGTEDLVLHDSLAHDSILGGARLAGARRRPFPHNDVRALESILREVRSSVRRVLIAIEGVYSMDGDISPLPEIIALKKKYGALLLVDEAHSLGVLGKTGRGLGEHFNVDRRDVDLWMGTMSKTLASCGGYIAGSAALIEFLKYTTPGFIYSVGMTPANAAAALCAIQILETEPERAVTCRDRSRYLVQACRARGIDTGPSEGSAVIPCIVGNSYAGIRLAEGLLGRGIHVHPIVYPAVADNLSRLRFFVTAAHTEEQLLYTADCLVEEMDKLGISPTPNRPAADPALPRRIADLGAN